MLVQLFYSETVCGSGWKFSWLVINHKSQYEYLEINVSPAHAGMTGESDT